MRQRASLGTQTAGNGAHRAPDSSTVRQTIRQDKQERLGRCGGDLRSRRAPEHALCAIKNVEQQAVLALHRVKQGFVKARTAQGNQIRGLLAEFGIIIPQGINNIGSRVPELIEDASNELPGTFRVLVQRLLDHLKELDHQGAELEAQIQAWHRNSDSVPRPLRCPVSGRLAPVP